MIKEIKYYSVCCEICNNPVGGRYENKKEAKFEKNRQCIGCGLFVCDDCSCIVKEPRKGNGYYNTKRICDKCLKEKFNITVNHDPNEEIVFSKAPVSNE